MIIDSKNETLNFILLRKGGDSIYIHKSIKKVDLPPIINISNNQNDPNLFSPQPFLSELTNFTNNNHKTKNSNNIESDINLKTNSLFSETQKIDESVFDTIINESSNKKTRSLGTSYDINDFSPNYNKNEVKCDKKYAINKKLISINNKENNNLFNKNLFKYERNLKSFDIQEKTFDNNIDNLNLKSIENLKSKNNSQKFMKIIEKEKKRDNFMNVLQRNENIFINDYLKKKLSKRKNKINLSFNNNNITNYKNYINQNYYKKERKPILVKDIAINSLLNEYENNKIKFNKLSPLIIREKYMKAKNSLNIKPEINKYELKIDINNNSKFPVKYKDLKHYLDSTNIKN